MTDPATQKTFADAPSMLQSAMQPKTAVRPTTPTENTQQTQIPPMAKDTEVTCMPVDFFQLRNQVELKKQMEKKKEEDEKKKEKDGEKSAVPKTGTPKTAKDGPSMIILSPKLPTSSPIPATSPIDDKIELDKNMDNNSRERSDFKETERKARSVRKRFDSKEKQKNQQLKKASQSSRSRVRVPNKSEFKRDVSQALINETLRLMAKDDKDVCFFAFGAFKSYGKPFQEP